MIPSAPVAPSSPDDSPAAMRTHRPLGVYTSPLVAIAAAASLLGAASAGCSDERAAPPADVTLVLAAYSTPREVMESQIVPAFAASFRAKTGKSLRVDASYLASGAQTRAVLGGFAADVVLLAMAPDVDKLASADLVAKTWADGPDRGIVASSVVAFAVRTGNPKAITGWADLARPGISVLMPNPKTSGGAMWNISALWGAALRGEAGFPPNDHEASHAYLRAVLGNVVVLDKGGRESVITFEKGVGDVAVTYETEIVAAHLAGRKYDAVIPALTLHIEIPAAVVAKNAATHGVTKEAEAFVAFLRSDTAQRAFARFGFRASDGVPVPETATSTSAAPTPPTTLFRIDDMGGWKKVVPMLFGPEGAFTKTWERVYAE